MANPWTKKNPFMSMWLSAANKVALHARGQATAEMKKQQAALATQATRTWVNAWLDAAKPKRHR
jgi:hypothetical protein